MLARIVINPPGPPNKDRTGPDQDRFKERNKPSKDKLPDIIKNNPIFDDKGKVKVPIDGGYEPRWRPGRDGQSGGGGGANPAEDEAEITYVDMNYEDFLRLFFDGLELPFLLRKMLSQTEVKTHKRRGITNNGPRSRLNKLESAKARLKRAIVMKNADPEEFPGTIIPGVDEVPFHKSDLKFGRIEERMQPDSKAVAFLLLDRSGSMEGDPIATAKAFFLLNILFLRAKYNNVAIVMIAHDAHAERVTDEGKFYQIEAGGGTVAVPAWKMALDIAEAEYSSGGWNRYMFHATDGMLFDGESVIAQWWGKIVESPFNYCGYLEITAADWGDPTAWAEGGQALLTLQPAVAAHVGMARVSSLVDLPRAFREILDKDRVKN